jgi:uncharacterized protein YyaL (SSP411 family)
VPHFEKMLYDQAQLVLAYLEAAQASQDPFFAQIAHDTLQYVQRHMTDSGGGFYSAEDADSVPPDQAGMADARKSEGAFYIWPLAEVRALLGGDSRVFELRYGLLPDGNAPFDPHNEFTGRNLLYTARGISDIAQATGRSPEDVAAALTRARATLFDARERRPRPHLDDKVLAGWNGLMIAAFARSARTLAGGQLLGQELAEDPSRRHLESAQRAARFIRQSMWDDERRVLLRRYRQGEAAIDAYAEDYAFLIFGLLELFQADGDIQWLDWAMTLQKVQDELFWDALDGGWFSTTGKDPSVLVRMKEEYDGAEPSASAVGTWNLLTLARITGDRAVEERAHRVFAAFGERLRSLGRAVPFMASALSVAHAPHEQIVIVGPPDSEATQALWRAANAPYRPFAIVVPVVPGAAQQALASRMPWMGAMSMRDGQPAAYACRDFTCEAPTTDPDTLRQ